MRIFSTSPVPEWAAFRAQNVPPTPIAARRRCHHGQALVEFGIISLLVFTIVVGTLSYGIQLWSATMLQQAADSAAIAASRFPLPPQSTFAQAIEDSNFRATVYDPKFLVVQDSELSGQTFREFMSTTPTLNRLLAPLMIRDGDMHRYPGTLVTYTDFDGSTQEETVLVPVLAGRGTRTLSWRFPVEEMTFVGNSSGQEYSVFSTFDSTYLPSVELPGGRTPPTGLAALRINYPYQSSTAVAVQYSDADGNPISVGEAEVAFNELISADENLTVDSFPTAFTATVSPTGFTPHAPGFALVGGDGSLGPFSGDYGLGRFVVGNTQVRPFRQVMSFQAVRLREVFR